MNILELDLENEDEREERLLEEARGVSVLSSLFFFMVLGILLVLALVKVFVGNPVWKERPQRLSELEGVQSCYEARHLQGLH